MPHTPNQRGFGDFMFDVFKPKVEAIIREYGGHAVYAIPAVSDALKLAVRGFGGRPTANAVLFAGGIAHIARRRFPPGERGNTLHSAANELIDEIAQAVAARSKDLTEEELTEFSRFAEWIGARARRLWRRGKGEPDMADQVLVEKVEGVGRIFHDKDCPKIDATVLIEVGEGDNKKTIRQKNPALDDMPLMKAKRFKETGAMIECETCGPMLAAAAVPAGQAAAKKTPKRPPLRHMAEVPPEKLAVFWEKLEQALTLLPEAERAAKRDELTEKLHMLDDPKEIEALLAMPNHVLIGKGFDLMRDEFNEELKEMGRGLRRSWSESRREAHTAMDNATLAMRGFNTGSAGRKAGLIRRLKRGV